MGISLQGQFTTVLLPANVVSSPTTLTDYSAYVTGVPDLDIGSDDVDLTTFAPGGVGIAETHLQGALVASLRISFLYDLVIAKVLRQLVGQRAGFSVQVRSGSNAAPTYGDEVVAGTFTLMSLPLVYAPGQPAKIDCTFAPADQGAITPTYSNY